MCLSVPRKIIQIDGKRALLQDNRWVRLDLVGEAMVGDYLLVHADLAVEKISPDQAKDMSKLINES